jgi:SAM-dependent methyltransferase
MRLPTLENAQVMLDLPADATISTPFDQLWGWILVRQPVADLRFSALGRDLIHTRIVRAVLDPNQHAGFSIYLDLPDLIPFGHEVPPELIVSCYDGEFMLCDFRIRIKDVTATDLDAQRISKLIRSKFVERNCNVDTRAYPGCRAPCALPENWDICPDLRAKADAVSSHFYGATVQDFLKGLGDGAMVLDVGAGFRKFPYPTVINLEIYDYPSTDILAASEHLPFSDGVFDGVLSLAVLEHVKNPHVCAREIERVLKPGGKVLAIIPFVQAEHGYPSHYFNATRFGVRELFRELTMERQFLEVSNQPIFTLNQILGLYASGLGAATRAAFLSLTVADLLGRSPMEWLNEPIVTELSPEVAWLIAWGTTTIFRKSEIGNGVVNPVC